MKMLHSLIFLTFSYVISIEAGYSGCTMNLENGLPEKNQPLYLEKGIHGKMDLLFPEIDNNRKPVVQFVVDEDIIIACPGLNNKLKATDLQINTVTCHFNNVWTINGHQVKLRELECNEETGAEAKIYHSNCAGGKGTQLGLGYKVGRQWLELIKSCHNIQQRETYFSEHTLRGLSITTTARSKREFIRGNVELYGFDPNSAYLTRNQKPVLHSVFGKNDVDLYDRGHLTPDADFTFVTHKAVTYMYPNAAPQNSKNNQEIWVAVESSVRLLAKKLASDVHVVTGTYGHLTNARSEPAKLYPPGRMTNTIPIPKYYWKMVKTPDSSCIVFVSKNVHEADTKFCHDLCNSSEWSNEIQIKLNYFRKLHHSLSQSIMGHVNCCDYREVKERIGYLPSEKCQKVLHFPNRSNSNRRRAQTSYDSIINM